MNYIEFKKDENLIVKIHYNGKLRVIKNKTNVKKILELCEKYGYGKIDEDCYIQDYISEIVTDYEKFYNKKKNNIKVYNTINKLMKLKNNKKIGTIILIGTLAAATTFGLSELKTKIEATEITTESNDYNDDNDIITYEDDESFFSNINIEKEEKEPEVGIKNESETEKQTNQSEIETEIDNMLSDDTFEFVFECENPEPEKLEKAKQYSDIFEKYGQMYGIDPKLLMAMAAQESGGNHYDFLYNYPAVGIMQIERGAHINQEITAYNHLEGKEETYLVTDDSLTNLESNIKVAAMLLQISLEANDYNIPLGIQTYNFGTGYIYQSLKMCEDISGIPISEMKSNMEETEWRYYREFLNVGDPYYVEHVLRFLSTGDEITIKNRANQDITLKIKNEAEKNKTY